MRPGNEVGFFSVLEHVPGHEHVSVALLRLILEHEVARVLCRVAVLEPQAVVLPRVDLVVHLLEGPRASLSIREHGQVAKLALVRVIVIAEHADDRALAYPDLLDHFYSMSQAHETLEYLLVFLFLV